DYYCSSYADSITWVF
nr:immunoglobulin light chain junction region [Macaca mulatta]MOX77842.1 immunoglobulin light chain junction region [Macaca mulatta]MOX77868.1 immunoglobulin light chain junction region [Macaca mulatta]MOX78267.1 immunoglobulin light chain junction region [Macaca mulatta]MOX78463.1 immunoglobulin light chain junction region [Macaca mulatta]